MKKSIAEQASDTLNRYINKIERLTDEKLQLIKERDQYKEMFDMQTKLVVDLEMRLIKMEEQLKNEQQ